uniref:RNase H type-1 domain-containing protein n=1 Tax=Chenopodium quinoa TaxID=63459 RepID=A0A803KVL0_CHEQI
YNLDHHFPNNEYNVAIAEAIAWRNGLKLAKTKNVKLDRIIGDNEEIILRVLGLEPRATGFSSLNEIIDEIQKTLRELSINPRSQVQRIGKTDNKTTNELAFAGSELGEKSYVREEDLPSKVAELIRQEKSISIRNIEQHYGEGSSLVKDVAKVGATVVGIVTGSDRHQLRNGGAGCIIRNEQGNLVIAAVYNLDHLFPNEYNVAIAEAIAWRNGLKLAKTKNVKLDRINGDNEEIILRMLGLEPRAPGFSSLNEIIDEIQKTLRELSINPRSQVQRIGKKDNKTTNVLAFSGSELGLNEEKSYVKEEDLPFKLYQSFQEDKRIWRNGVMDGVHYTQY